MGLGIKKESDSNEKIILVPSIDIDGKRIIIYGAGTWGKYFYEQYVSECIITHWVDSNFEYLPPYRGVRIQSPDVINDCKIELIIIAIQNVKVQRIIKDTLLTKGINKNRIVLLQDSRSKENASR